MSNERRAKVRRETAETTVSVELSLDGSGNAELQTGVGMLDHLLDQLARHGLFDLAIEASGDAANDPHHLVEDVAITLGQALTQALGDRRGIRRMGHAVVPMDDALALVAVDIGGRGHAAVEATFAGEKLGGLPSEMVGHFLRSLAMEGRFNLHARLLAGENDHHKAEALFKALALALDAATAIDERRAGQVPSTKGVIEG